MAQFLEFDEFRQAKSPADGVAVPPRESQEAFEAFGATFVPIMVELGADPGEPMVARVHNVIDG